MPGRQCPAHGEPRHGSCAPPGAITVASPHLDDRDGTSKGFYIRHADGVLEYGLPLRREVARAVRRQLPVKAEKAEHAGAWLFARGKFRQDVENIVDGVVPPEQATLETMLGQTQRLGGLVEQLLDLSRLESGVIPFERHPFVVAPLLEQSLRESKLSHDGRAGNVELRLSVEPPELAVDGDPERVHQVVTNVIHNAVRHSPSGGVVEVRARPAGGAVLIEVTDEGPGIPEQEAGRVFVRFYGSDSARTSSDGGTGLGLAIAKWIVDMHGGDIRAERRSPKGCRMVVSLPGRTA
jgi:signal transduction histidine kinase